jgi:hypothetical protein
VLFHADYRSFWGFFLEDLGLPYPDYLQGPEEKPALIQIDVTLKRDADAFERKHVVVHTNGSLLSSAEQFGAVSINLANDYLAPTGIDLPECKLLAAAHPDMASVDGSVVTLSGLGGGLAYPEDKLFINAEAHYGFFLWAHDGDEAPPRIYPAAAEMARLFNAVIKNLVVGLIREFETQAGFVPASRKVPADEELTFVVPLRRLLPFDQALAPEAHSSGLTGLAPSSDPAYRELASSLAAKVAWREFSPHLTPPEATNLIDRVNESLTGPLFRERGYFLDADFNILLDPETYMRLASGVAEEAAVEDRLTVALTIRLRDAHHRTLSMVDVGSGIGYCLPVLNSVWSKPLSLVQQPELHLHPALQSALADVLIEAMSEGHRAIVETHSEHLLLRILRRIRDTSRVGPIPERHGLSAAAVAVYYFDPQPDGSTRAKRLRISPEGEFLDRWPRGFFTERDRDVFDE